jgi:ubiquinone/menaquinone biosynthesis C-methylase UbiE
MSAAEANRRLYAGIASVYDQSEECVTDARLRARSHAALARACAELERRRPLQVLDACGGSGNVSLMLFEMGIPPVTVDISPEMLSIYEAKARRQGLEPECITAEIDAFLRSDPRAWDLIVFSSALHHLDDVDAVVDHALARIRPGGILLTLFDPTRVSRLGQRLRRIDYLLHVIVRTPQRLPVLCTRRLLGRCSKVDEQREIGVLAERHALVGIDDIALAQRLEATGNTIIEHRRYFEGRFALTRRLFQSLGMASAFELMVQTPLSDGILDCEQPRGSQRGV